MSFNCPIKSVPVIKPAGGLGAHLVDAAGVAVTLAEVRADLLEYLRDHLRRGGVVEIGHLHATAIQIRTLKGFVGPVFIPRSHRISMKFVYRRICFEYRKKCLFFLCGSATPMA